MVVSVYVQAFRARHFVCLNQVARNVLASSHDSSSEFFFVGHDSSYCFCFLCSYAAMILVFHSAKLRFVRDSFKDAICWLAVLFGLWSSCNPTSCLPPYGSFNLGAFPESNPLNKKREFQTKVPKTLCLHRKCTYQESFTPRPRAHRFKLF